MKRSIRWYLIRGIIGAFMSMLFLFVTAGPAIAWSQARNPFTENGSGTGWCSGYGTNGTDNNYPCMYWQEPAYTSINLYFYVDPVLGNVEGYDFTGAMIWAFTQWNSAPAWNPYMNWQSGSQHIDGFYTLGLASDPVLTCANPAYTLFTAAGPIEHGYNPQRGGTEYYKFIRQTAVKFNPNTLWNSNGIYYPYCPGKADGFEVTVHESGHVMGMGHSGVNAIMNSSTHNIYLQQDDKDGMAGIYPGNQQHS